MPQVAVYTYFPLSFSGCPHIFIRGSEQVGGAGCAPKKQWSGEPPLAVIIDGRKGRKRDFAIGEKVWRRLWLFL